MLVPASNFADRSFFKKESNMENRKPSFERMLGLVRVTVWKNVSESKTEGKPPRQWYSTSIVRRYKSGSDWKDAHTFIHDRCKSCPSARAIVRGTLPLVLRPTRGADCSALTVLLPSTSTAPCLHFLVMKSLQSETLAVQLNNVRCAPLTAEVRRA